MDLTNNFEKFLKAQSYSRAMEIRWETAAEDLSFKTTTLNLLLDLVRMEGLTGRMLTDMKQTGGEEGARKAEDFEKFSSWGHKQNGHRIQADLREHAGPKGGQFRHHAGHLGHVR